MPSGPTVFVDTNVLVYAEDRAAGAKQASAFAWLHELWLQRAGRLSVQVLHEFYVCTTRKLGKRMAPGDARAEVRRYQQWQPWANDHATVEAAWAVESRYKFSYWDALIVAAAQAQGCTYLLSEDLQHEQQLDGVQVIDPFRVGPELLGVRPAVPPKR